MSTQWMAVQYVGDTLRLPVVNESDMDKPFGSSMLGREVRRIVINPLSDTPQVFVPETENAKQCERICKLEGLVFDTLTFALACVWHLNEIAGYERMEPGIPTTDTFASLLHRARELGVPDA